MMAIKWFGSILLTVAHLTTVHAAPVFDDERGIAVEQFDNLLGVDQASSGTFNIELDPWSRSLSASDENAPAQFVTQTYTPASVKRWREVRVAAQVSDASEIAVDVLDADEQLLATMVLTPSTVDGWDFVGVIDEVQVNPAAYPELRLRVRLDGTAAPFAPVLERLGVTWEPLSVIAIDASATASACAGTGISYDVAVSVSRVGAEQLVVKLLKPVAEGGPPSHSANLAFASATEGGQVHMGPGPLVFGELTVNPGDVYWVFDAAIQAGTTFIVSATFRIPNGAAEAIEYRSSAAADAANAESQQTQDVHSGVSADPAPLIYLGYGGAIRIFELDRARAGDTLTTTVTVVNDWAKTCRQTYFQAIVAHDLSGFGLPPTTLASGPDFISDTGVFVGVGQTRPFYGVNVTGPKVVWTRDALAVGASASFTYKFTLAGTPPLVDDQLITTSATVISAWERHAHA